MQYLADHWSPSDNVTWLSCGIDSVEVSDNPYPQPVRDVMIVSGTSALCTCSQDLRNELLQDTLSACLVVRSRISVHAQKHIDKCSSTAGLLFEEVRQLFHETCSRICNQLIIRVQMSVV